MTDHARPKSADAEAIELRDAIANVRLMINNRKTVQVAVLNKALNDLERAVTQPSPHSGEWNAAIESLGEIVNLSRASIGDPKSESIGERDAMQWLETIEVVANCALDRLIQQSGGEVTSLALTEKESRALVRALVESSDFVCDLETRPPPQQPEAQAGVTEEQIARIIVGDLYARPEKTCGPATLAVREEGITKARAILAILPQAGKNDAETASYRIIQFDEGFEPQHQYSAGFGDGLFWYPLDENGFWKEPEAFTFGNPKIRSVMSKDKADRSILRARAINQEHIALLPGGTDE